MTVQEHRLKALLNQMKVAQIRSDFFFLGGGGCGRVWKKKKKGCSDYLKKSRYETIIRFGSHLDIVSISVGGETPIHDGQSPETFRFSPTLTDLNQMIR